MSESLSQKYERILSMCEVGKRHGVYTQIRCPISANHKHDDREKSASLGLHSDGISFKCFAGCQTDDFLRVMGLTYRDLYPDDERVPTNIYTYHNEDGSPHHDKLKYRNFDGKKVFKQRTIDDNGTVVYKATGGIPFQYPQLKEAIKQDRVILLLEGEKDCLTAKVLGWPATTMGGASDWKDEYKQFFAGANLILVPDKDDPGLKLTGKMIDSLKTVAKSLKTMILPIGKDLTEWVEAGNSDIKSLIDKTATELITTNGIPEPVVKVIVGGYEFYWIGMNLKVVIDRIENDEEMEISVYENERPIYISGIKLLSISHKESIVRALKAVNPKIPWVTIVNQVAVQALSRIRAGEEVIWLGHEYESKRPEYLIHPLFAKNVPNIIYGDRSSAKSLFMSLIALILYLNWQNNPFSLNISGEHKVLILDWENDSDVTKWQLRCLAEGIDIYAFEIAYMHCSRSLVKSLFHIQQKINEVGADTVIIDSLGLAVGKNLNDTEPALDFFNALRQLPVTPLIIAHNAKDANNKIKTVYGNAFYENLARSIWEVNKYQVPNSPELNLSLYQRKAPPFSSYSAPLGFHFKFDGDRTYITPCEPQDDKRDS